MSNDWYEKQYSPSFWSKKHNSREDVIQDFLDVATKQSENARRNLSSRLDVKYGPLARQKIDYFYPSQSKKAIDRYPVIIYIHGGYWTEGEKELYSFIAKPFTLRGFVFAVMGYDLAPEVTIPQIISQIETAVQSVQHQFKDSKIILVGHSAGAYLAAAVANAGNVSVSAVFLISGIYDLVPLIHVSVNDTLKLDEENARYLDMMTTLKTVEHVYVYVGGDESPEFCNQSKIFSKKQLIENFNVVTDEDHFSLVLNLRFENFVLTKSILDLGERMI